MSPAHLSFGQGARWPLPLDAQKVAALAQAMLGRPYGWGGLFGWRDCSAAVKELFAPFGLWLDRNSGDQAKNGASFISLAGLEPTEKARLIKEKAIPLASLLWMPGHIMLYAGQGEDGPLVWHTMWGAKTWGLLRGEGRAVVGQTAVTTLNPGREIIGFAGRAAWPFGAAGRPGDPFGPGPPAGGPVGPARKQGRVKSPAFPGRAEICISFGRES